MIKKYAIWSFLLLSSIHILSCRKRDEPKMDLTREYIHGRARINNSDYVYKETYNVLFGPVPNDPFFIAYSHGYISTVIHLEPTNNKSDSISFTIDIKLKPKNMDDLSGESFIIIPDNFWKKNNTAIEEEYMLGNLDFGVGIVRIYSKDKDLVSLPSGVIRFGHKTAKKRYSLKYELFDPNLYLGSPAKISGELSVSIVKSHL